MAVWLIVSPSPPAHYIFDEHKKKITSTLSLSLSIHSPNLKPKKKRSPMDSDFGIPRELSPLQQLRSQYQPQLPPCLQVLLLPPLLRLLIRSLHVHSCYCLKCSDLYVFRSNTLFSLFPFLIISRSHEYFHPCESFTVIFLIEELAIVSLFMQICLNK